MFTAPKVGKVPPERTSTLGYQPIRYRLEVLVLGVSDEEDINVVVVGH